DLPGDVRPSRRRRAIPARPARGGPAGQIAAALRARPLPDPVQPAAQVHRR
ncbi:MAG: hypothetical protein AMXMBFR83_15740, partial [Phycisphaerae bacterium]